MCNEAYFKFLMFRAIFGVDTTHTLINLKTQPKNWLTKWTFWANCYLEIMFYKCSGATPLSMHVYIIKFFVPGTNIIGKFIL